MGTNGRGKVRGGQTQRVRGVVGSSLPRPNGAQYLSPATTKSGLGSPNKKPSALKGRQSHSLTPAGQFPNPPTHFDFFDATIFDVLTSLFSIVG